VILEAGSGCCSTHWRTVLERIGEFASVYRYDRAGHGDSDAAGDGSLSDWLAGLEAWLAAMRVRSPFLPVGHSLGGHVVGAYAAARRADVAGRVLVDARHEDLYLLLPAAFLTRLAEAYPYGTTRATRAYEIIRGGPDLGDIPLSVITHCRFDWLPDDWGLPTRSVPVPRLRGRTRRDGWRASTWPRLVGAADAGHMIAADRPDVIVEEIRSVMNSVS
jgi:pimeloyl-ACP methyl ester carboxylesterase